LGHIHQLDQTFLLLGQLKARSTDGASRRRELRRLLVWFDREGSSALAVGRERRIRVAVRVMDWAGEEWAGLYRRWEVGCLLWT
jgi:hypothetical protein